MQDLKIRRVIMPLFNFQSELNKIKLDSNLWIRKISQDQVKSLQEGFMTIIDEFDMPLITHALETEIPYESRKVNEANELFRTTVLGLRLFKSGHIHEKVTFFTTKKGRGGQAFWSREPIRFDPSRPYKFAEDDVNALVKLLTKIRSLDIDSHPALKIPLHRFNKSYDDPLEEKFVDVMIAFESLVRVGRGHKGEKISIGISMLIGKTSEERNTVRKDVATAYKVRNGVVHGEILHVDKDKENLYYQVEDYLRRAVLKILD